MRGRLVISSVLAAGALVVGAISLAATRSSATDPGAVVPDSTVAPTVPDLAVATPINEVGDPGAEAGWTSASSAAGTTLRRDETRAHTGLASFALIAPVAGGDVVLDDSPNWVMASPGPTCTASAWVAGTPGVTVSLTIMATPVGGVPTTASTPLVLPDADWHAIETTLAVAPGTPVDLRISGLALAGNTQLWIDDITENCGQAEPPAARLLLNTTTGIAPLTVTADASSSSDPNLDIVSYAFDWGDGSPANVLAAPTATHVYDTAGSFTITVTVTDGASLSAFATQSVTVAPPPPPPGDPVVVAAGDITCAGGAISNGCAAERTAALIARLQPTRVLPLGDLHYGATRTAADFQASYGPFPDPVAHPSWGDFKAITSPTIGSHEYDGHPTADGYFEYWNGSATADGPAGKPTEGWYAEDIGTWRVIHVNTQKGYKVNEPQNAWLAAELAAHPQQCTLITWHHPRFSSGAHGNQARTEPLFATAHAGGADVLLSGNDHLYERFGPQNPAGSADPTRGVTQFVAGSGGKGLYSWGAIQPNSQFRNNTTFGVLALTLHDGSYDWAWVGVDGQTLDSGTAACTR